MRARDAKSNAGASQLPLPDFRLRILHSGNEDNQDKYPGKAPPKREKENNREVVSIVLVQTSLLGSEYAARNAVDAHPILWQDLPF